MINRGLDASWYTCIALSHDGAEATSKLQENWAISQGTSQTLLDCPYTRCNDRDTHTTLSTIEHKKNNHQ
jgi:hypothetical protein